jgi:hypothetical protein
LGELHCAAVSLKGTPSRSEHGGKKRQKKVPTTEHRQLNGVVIYTFWNIWKERNRRIFNNTAETGPQVAVRIKEDIEQRKRAFAYA